MTKNKYNWAHKPTAKNKNEAWQFLLEMADEWVAENGDPESVDSIMEAFRVSRPTAKKIMDYLYEPEYQVVK